jgi:hypothetical protein
VTRPAAVVGQGRGRPSARRSPRRPPRPQGEAGRRPPRGRPCRIDPFLTMLAEATLQAGPCHVLREIAKLGKSRASSIGLSASRNPGPAPVPAATLPPRTRSRSRPRRPASPNRPQHSLGGASDRSARHDLHLGLGRAVATVRRDADDLVRVRGSSPDTAARHGESDRDVRECLDGESTFPPRPAQSGAAKLRPSPSLDLLSSRFALLPSSQHPEYAAGAPDDRLPTPLPFVVRCAAHLVSLSPASRFTTRP